MEILDSGAADGGYESVPRPRRSARGFGVYDDDFNVFLFLRRLAMISPCGCPDLVTSAA
jgi:hypothetical protein